jgi:hypothetical protein
MKLIHWTPSRLRSSIIAVRAGSQLLSGAGVSPAIIAGDARAGHSLQNPAQLPIKDYAVQVLA